MFLPNSRYAGLGSYAVTRPDGSAVTVTNLPLPAPRPVTGWHRRADTENLDLLAGHYLGDPTAGWLLGWTNGAVSLDALAARELLAIPRPG